MAVLAALKVAFERRATRLLELCTLDRRRLRPLLRAFHEGEGKGKDGGGGTTPAVEERILRPRAPHVTKAHAAAAEDCLRAEVARHFLCFLEAPEGNERETERPATGEQRVARCGRRRRRRRGSGQGRVNRGRASVRAWRLLWGRATMEHVQMQSLGAVPIAAGATQSAFATSVPKAAAAAAPAAAGPARRVGEAAYRGCLRRRQEIAVAASKHISRCGPGASAAVERAAAVLV